MKREILRKLEQRRKLQNLVDITFYIPCCNEEQNIIASLEKLVRTVRPMHLTYELLIFNDGSTDNTQKRIEKYKRNHPELIINIIQRKKRRGLGYNYIDGAFKGLGKYYMMICGDNSETEESIRQVLGKMGTADVIIPYFGTRDTRNFFRKYLSKIFTVLVNSINGYNIRYYNGIVLHLRENIIRWHPTSSGFAYQAELLSILLDHHKTYREINISNNDRKSGITKAFNVQNYFSVAHSLLQIFFARIRRSIWPYAE